MIKMLLFDLDDTLLCSDKTISDRTRTALCKVHGLGLKLGYVTARSPRSVLGLIEGLPVDAVSYYGGVKTCCDGVMVSRIDIPHKDGVAIVNEIKKEKVKGIPQCIFRAIQPQAKWFI